MKRKHDDHSTEPEPTDLDRKERTTSGVTPTTEEVTTAVSETKATKATVVAAIRSLDNDVIPLIEGVAEHGRLLDGAVTDLVAMFATFEETRVFASKVGGVSPDLKAARVALLGGISNSSHAEDVKYALSRMKGRIVTFLRAFVKETYLQILDPQGEATTCTKDRCAALVALNNNIKAAIARIGTIRK